MLFRWVCGWLLLAVPCLCLAAEDPRPACSSQNQGRMWPEAANRDAKLFSRLVRCGELFLCVHGNWRYHWETPSIRLDQLARHDKQNIPKPTVCEVQSTVDVSRPNPATNTIGTSEKAE
jgi:hypothetical protein